MTINEFANALPEFWIGSPDWPLTIGPYGLMEESGEVAGEFKKLLRGSAKDLAVVDRPGRIAAELGDVLFYTIAVSKYGLGIDLQDTFIPLEVKSQDNRAVMMAVIGLNGLCVSLAEAASSPKESVHNMGIRPVVELIIAYIEYIASIAGSSLEQVMALELDKIRHAKALRDA